MIAIFGEAHKDLILTSDRAGTSATRGKILAAMQTLRVLREPTPDRRVLVIGAVRGRSRFPSCARVIAGASQPKKAQLDTGRVRDDAGKLRLAYRTPDWEDFVGLAVTEIRQFGRDSIQIVRRMRAMLESLIRTVPPQRTAPLRVELELLGRGVQLDFRDPEDRVRAASGDALGVGGTP